MKAIVYSICVGSLALALTAQGEEVQGTANVDAKAKTRGTPKVHAARSARTNAAVSNTRMQPTVTGTRFRAHTVTPQTNVDTSLQNRQRFNQSITARNSRPINRERNLMANRNVTVNQNQNVVINRNRVSFSQAVNLHRHEFHDRDFWRRHFRIVIINNNAFFFDAGCWFPAWGYFPGAYYPYDGPIYGYNGLTPDQVVVNAQVQLQREGYYAGPIDGIFGTTKRHAMDGFQNST